MFVRFVVSAVDEKFGPRLGPFQAAQWLKESGHLSIAEVDELKKLYAWFNDNLKKPDRLSLSPRPHSASQALSWFKDSATMPIGKMHELTGMLERNGVHVQVITADRIGYVLYEDEFQVAAYPFRDTPT